MIVRLYKMAFEIMRGILCNPAINCAGCHHVIRWMKLKLAEVSYLLIIVSERDVLKSALCLSLYL